MKCFLDIIKTHKSYINCFCFSVAQSCVILQSHGLQHARLSCPSLSPGLCSNSCSLSWWHHPTILSSVAPFSCPQSFPASQCVGSSHQVAKVLKLQLQHQSFQWMFRTDFLYDWLVESPCCPRDSQESSPTPQFKSISSSVPHLLALQNYVFSVLFHSFYHLIPVTNQWGREGRYYSRITDEEA